MNCVGEMSDEWIHAGGLLCVCVQGMPDQTGKHLVWICHVASKPWWLAFSTMASDEHHLQSSRLLFKYLLSMITVNKW